MEIVPEEMCSTFSSNVEESEVKEKRARSVCLFAKRTNDAKEVLIPASRNNVH